MCVWEQDARRRRDSLPSRHERIERKHRLLEQRDSEYAVKLDRTFTSHLATAIQASGPNERRQALDAATRAYEDALDDALRGALARSTRLPVGTTQ
jgi:hypothetical protein